MFTSAYVFYWPEYFPNDRLRYPPTFDSRVVLYPGEKEIRDYFAWRQADSECALVCRCSLHVVGGMARQLEVRPYG